MNPQNPLKGRGTLQNPKNKFVSQDIGFDEIDDYKKSSKIEIINDSSQSILSYNNSPDIPYNIGLIHTAVVNMVVPTAMLSYSMSFWVIPLV